METALACRSCFERQIDSLADHLLPHDAMQRDRLRQVCLAALADSVSSSPPPETAARIYAAAADFSGCADPFAAHKRAANAKALTLLPELRRRVEKAEDPLLTCLRVSIIANYNDGGVARTFDWESALREEREQEQFPGLPVLRTCLESGPRKICILGDNAGEIAVDILLVEHLQALGHEVVYAVRDRPILNDATLEDAKAVGLDTVCRVVSSGVDSPGTLLHRCSAGFLQELEQADIVVSKGQGNFEALHGRLYGVFFAFKVKCPVVADLAGLPEQTSVFVFSEAAS